MFMACSKKSQDKPGIQWSFLKGMVLRTQSCARMVDSRLQIYLYLQMNKTNQKIKRGEGGEMVIKSENEL